MRLLLSFPHCVRRQPARRLAGRSALVVLFALAAALVPRPVMAEVQRAEVEDLALAGGAERTDLDAFDMVAVSWQRGSGDTPPALWVRRAGTWESVSLERAADDLDPDDATAELARAVQGRVFTEPVWVGRADAVRVGATGLADLTVHVYRQRTTTTFATTGATAGAAVPADGPTVFTREQWGAVPPRQPNDVSRTLQFAVVHHTASSNNYGPDEVPAILRSLQAFFLNTRGYNDMAYNFLVDKFGRIWEGRGGGIAQPVIGAHATGANTSSVGVSVIGDFTQTGPTAAISNAVGDLVGWKLALHGVDPQATFRYTALSTNRWPEGTTVTIPTVVGHQDVGQTDCPGSIEAALPAIRARAAQRAAYARGVVDSVQQNGSVLTVSGWAFDRRTTDPIAVVADVNGNRYPSVLTSVARPDVAAVFAGAGPTTGFRFEVPLPEGSSTVCIGALEASYGAFTPLGPCRGFSRPRLSPVGAIDVVERIPQGVRVRGWAAEEGSPGPVIVDITMDGRLLGQAAAIGLRAAPSGFPLVGADRAFEQWYPAVAGSHTFCVTARNNGAGTDQPLGCRTIGVPVGSSGAITFARWWGPILVVLGWAVDYDTGAPATARLSVNDRPAAAAVANRPGPAQPAIPPAYGTARLFATLVAPPTGQFSRLCLDVDASNARGGDPSPRAGCVWVWPAPPQWRR